MSGDILWILIILVDIDLKVDICDYIIKDKLLSACMITTNLSLFSETGVCVIMCHRCLMVSADKWVYGLAVDPEKDKLYITDYGSKKIVVTSLDGSGERTLLNCTDLPRGLVVDRIKR